MSPAAISSIIYASSEGGEVSYTPTQLVIQQPSRENVQGEEIRTQDKPTQKPVWYILKSGRQKPKPAQLHSDAFITTLIFSV